MVADIDGASSISFSVFYFSGSANARSAHRCQTFLDVARAARLGFEAVWIPERHFHDFGGPYPNPSVLAAAVAMVTGRIGIRAGSVVLPLQSPLRVVEEWAVVDGARVSTRVYPPPVQRELPLWITSATSVGT